MRNEDIVRAYTSHLGEIVYDKDHEAADFCLLLDTLFRIPFRYYIFMDENRLNDGFDLRNDFLESEYGLTGMDLDLPISVLEVLIALAVRMEKDILADPMSGKDNSHLYFWDMLSNLDVEKYSNDNFKEVNIREKCEKWMTRNIKKDGSGGIFVTKRKNVDMRNMEIWSQMQCYIMENY